MRTQSATEKRKKRRKRRHGAAFYAVPLVLLMTIALIILSYKLLRLETIEVEGTTRYQTGEIISASGLSVGKPMLKIKPSAVISSIEQKLSYIGDTQLRFELPSTIILSVSEATVACSVENGSSYILLSDKFKVLQADSPLAEANAPIIKGLKPKEANQGKTFLPENNEDITVLQALFNAFAENAFPSVKEIDLTDISDIKLSCQDNCSILLGGTSQLAYKVEFVKQVLDKNTDLEEAGGLIINAQALDSETHPNVSVLPARSIYSGQTSSEPTGPGDQDPAAGENNQQSTGQTADNESAESSKPEEGSSQQESSTNADSADDTAASSTGSEE